MVVAPDARRNGSPVAMSPARRRRLAAVIARYCSCVGLLRLAPGQQGHAGGSGGASRGRWAWAMTEAQVSVFSLMDYN